MCPWKSLDFQKQFQDQRNLRALCWNKTSSCRFWITFSSTWFFVSFNFLTLRKNHPFGTVALKMCETSSRDDWAAPPKKQTSQPNDIPTKKPTYGAMFKEFAKRLSPAVWGLFLDAHKVKPLLSTRSAGATSNNKKRRKETKTHSGKSTILMCEHFGSFPTKNLSIS